MWLHVKSLDYQTFLLRNRKKLSFLAQPSKIINSLVKNTKVCYTKCYSFLKTSHRQHTHKVAMFGVERCLHILSHKQFLISLQTVPLKSQIKCNKYTTLTDIQYCWQKQQMQFIKIYFQNIQYFNYFYKYDIILYNICNYYNLLLLIIYVFDAYHYVNSNIPHHICLGSNVLVYDMNYYYLSSYYCFYFSLGILDNSSQ